jgi:hypothetical protein
VGTLPGAFASGRFAHLTNYCSTRFPKAIPRCIRISSRCFSTSNGYCSTRASRSTQCIFPTGAIVSLVIGLSTGEMIEAAMVGRDGVVGAAALDGKISLSRAIVQLGGGAFRCDVDALKGAALQSHTILAILIRPEQTVSAQAQQSAACMATHDIEARVCRWLLRARDLASSDTLHFTQEFLAENAWRASPTHTTTDFEAAVISCRSDVRHYRREFCTRGLSASAGKGPSNFRSTTFIGFKPPDKALAAPDFYSCAVHPLLGPHQRVFVAVAHEAAKIDEVSIGSECIDTIFGHHGCAGDRKPGEDSHWLMRNAVSACRAFLNSNSRSMPAGNDPAFSRSRAASLVKRSSKLGRCFPRSHLMETPPRSRWIEIKAARGTVSV